MIRMKGQIEKLPVFRVTRPYLNLLVEPRTFFRFSGKNIIYMHFERQMSFKMYKIKFFSRKKKIKKYVCLPDLKFSDPLPKTHLFFIWPYLFWVFFLFDVRYCALLTLKSFVKLLTGTSPIQNAGKGLHSYTQRCQLYL